MSERPVVGSIVFPPVTIVAPSVTYFSPEIKAQARDAARYRWLREQVKDHARMVEAQALFWLYSSRTEFDKAIDEAMRGK